VNPPPTGGWPARLAIARRDLVEFIRDRRALFITLVMPMAMYPLLALSSTLGLRTALVELDRRAELHRLDLVFTGDAAEPLAIRIGMLADRGEGPPENWPESVTGRVVDAESAQSLIDEGAADAWIDVPRGSLATLDGAGTLTLEVRLSSRRPPDRRVKESVVAVMRVLADEARLVRLRRAGLPPSVLEPLRVDFIGDVPQGSAAAIRDVLPAVMSAVLVLLALLTATGAFYPAIDAIAGEKERGTIETLLIAPCPMFDVVVGKFLAVFSVTVATLAANALSIVLTSTVLGRFLPGALTTGLNVGDVAACSLLTLVAYLGLAAVAAALCLTVTAAAKSAKEAQNTLTPVVMLIAALAGAAVLPGAEARRWLPAVPFAGHVAVARAMLSAFGGWATEGRAAEARAPTIDIPVAMAISVVSSLAITWLLLRVTAHLVGNEEILFRGGEEATRGFQRPARRLVPSIRQGCGVIAIGFAALWYAQGLAPAEFVPALIVQQALAVLVPLVAVSAWQRVDARTTFALRRPGAGWPPAAATIAGGLLIGAGLFGIGAAITLAVGRGEVSADAKRFAEQIVALIQRGPTWAVVLILAVMPAVCEELLFRGWVLSAFAGRSPGPRRAAIAVVVQAAAFAAFHLLPERMPQTFALGLALGALVLATGSILPAIAAHVAHNATPVLLVARASAADLAAVDPSASALPPWSIAAAVGCVLVGSLLVVAAGRRGKKGDPWMDATTAAPRAPES
jgi:sodium transport system permease protein